MKQRAAEQWLVEEGWRPEVAHGLAPWLSGAADEVERPVAVFDFDNTLIFGDIGELYGQYLVDEVRYRYDLEAFWDLVAVEDGRDGLRELAQAIASTPPERREEHPLFEAYRRQMSGLYQRRFERLGRRDCYEWAVKLHVGISEAEMVRWSREAIVEELRRAQYAESMGTADGETPTVRRGIRVIRQMRGVMERLRQQGYEVWIVSASNWWTVSAVAPLFGVAENRVLGNRVEVDDQGRLTARRKGPALFREGKVAIIEEKIGGAPQLAMGDAITDKEMLEMALGEAVLIDRGDAAMREAAKTNRWLVQGQSELEGIVPRIPWKEEG